MAIPTPYSYRQYTGDGAAKDFSVPFPYLEREHVHLYLDRKELVEGTDYVWTSTVEVQLTAAPQAPVAGTPPTPAEVLTVRRITPEDLQIVQWKDGSYIIQDDLNESDLQWLYLIQEHHDQLMLLQHGVPTLPGGGSPSLGTSFWNRIARHTDPSRGTVAETAQTVDTKDQLNGDWVEGDKHVATTGAISKRLDVILSDGKPAELPLTEKRQPGKFWVDTDGLQISWWDDTARAWINAGAAGPIGPAGPPGPAGADGVAGPQGPIGPMGPQGPQGLDGAAGAAGPTGPQGPQGPQGIQGVPGPQGATGPQGPAGVDGATGPQGPAGADAPLFEFGGARTVADANYLTTLPAINPYKPVVLSLIYDGTATDLVRYPKDLIELWVYSPTTITLLTAKPGDRVGDWVSLGAIIPIKGDKGDKGDTGDTGATGPQGPQGLQGIQGPEGPAGPAGPTGPEGPAGATGPAGVAPPNVVTTDSDQTITGDKVFTGSVTIPHGPARTVFRTNVLGSAHEWGFVQWSEVQGVTTGDNAYGKRTIATTPPPLNAGADGDIWYQV